MEVSGRQVCADVGLVWFVVRRGFRGEQGCVRNIQQGRKRRGKGHMW
jgi:hypothetical protein